MPAEDVLATAIRVGGKSFDAPGANYTHRDDLCTFEVLIDDYRLQGDPGSPPTRHNRSCCRRRSGTWRPTPIGPGLLAIGVGGLEVETDDYVLLERASFVYDALYAWCQLQTAH